MILSVVKKANGKLSVKFSPGFAKRGQACYTAYNRFFPGGYRNGRSDCFQSSEYVAGRVYRRAHPVGDFDAAGLSGGGGISSFEDAARLLDAGADKITINTAAVLQPEIITRIASRYGSQFVVVATDARMVASGTAAEPVEATSLYGNAYWQVMTHGGKRPTDKELYSWAKQVQNLGAGEILFTSMDNDGTKNGYAVQAYSHLAEELTIPVIASGGAGSVADIEEVLTTGRADAALAASIFHYGEISIPDLKRTLRTHGVNVRI